MAAPIIDRITVSPETIAPGGSAQVVIQAHDPDEKVLSFEAEAFDSAGNPSGRVKGQVLVADPLTYELTVPDGSGLTVKQSATEPHVFIVTAAE